jgi:hypothetical protein
MRWLVALLVTAVVVVVGVEVFGDAFHTPRAFCPDDVADDDPHDSSELDAHPPAGVVVYSVGDEGMDDVSGQLASLFPADFPYRPALVCQYRTTSDEQLAECGPFPMVRTRYDYKVYAVPGKELLGVFDLPGTPRCPAGISTGPTVPTEPDYPGVVEHLAPLLR